MSEAQGAAVSSEQMQDRAILETVAYAHALVCHYSRDEKRKDTE
jgi:hypothetical protein